MRYAVVKVGVVDNVIKWDGRSPLELPEGETLVPLTDEAWIGWRYNTTDGFTPPKES